MNELFKDADIISAYTRADALEDGVLADVSDLAREAGFRAPVAVTSAVFDILDPSEELKNEGQDVKGRIWDMLTILLWEIKKAKDSDAIYFAPLFVLKPNFRSEPVKMWAKAGPGDNGELVITVMMENED